MRRETGYNLEVDLSRGNIERVESDPRLTELQPGVYPFLSPSTSFFNTSSFIFTINNFAAPKTE